MKFGKHIIVCCVASAVMLAGCGGNRPTGGGDSKPLPQPFAREDIETLEYREEDYLEALSRPYWMGNVIYNEIAIPYNTSDDGTQAYASLLYAPIRVISVKDRALGKTYEEGADYIVDYANKRLIIPDGSSIPTLPTGVETGKEIPDGYELTTGDAIDNLYQIWNSAGKGNFVYTEGDLFHGKYLSVSYAYDVEGLHDKPFHAFDANYLTKVRAKLEAGENIVLGVLGDSISAGNSATGDVLHVAPNTPGYVNQLKAEIERVYGVEVALVNAARGGTTSDWPLGAGSDNLRMVQQAKPDLVVIAYGMNDGAPGGSVRGAEFGENLAALMSSVKVWSSDCEFILVNSFPCHSRYSRIDAIFDEYLEAMQLLDEGDGSVCVVDMHSVGESMLEIKHFAEIASNNVNHPNDFMHRIYAMNIMSALFDYAKA